MSDTADVLRRARDRIGTPRRWVRRMQMAGTTPDGARLCADGALCWATSGDPIDNGPGYVTARAALEAVLPDIEPDGYHDFDGTLEYFNDTRSHADVMAAFDRAIELAEQP